LDTKCI